MLVLIDNYDSFTYNLVHYFQEIGEKVKVLEVNLDNQENTLKTLLELVLLGDLVSINLAAKLTVDPNNIDTIEKLKKLLGE